MILFYAYQEIYFNKNNYLYVINYKKGSNKFPSASEES